MDLRATLTAGIRADGTKTRDFANAGVSINYSKPVALTDGTGANQADVMFDDERTLAASGSEELNLADGSLTDALGDAIEMASIKAVYFENRSTTGNLVIGGAASNGGSNWLGGDDETEVVLPGGFVLRAAGGTGYTYAEGSDDVIKVTNGDSSNPLTYRIIVIGTSA